MAKELSQAEVDKLQGQALDLLNKERMAWESEVVFITRKVAFNMRNLIEQCRKNYWGVFDKPTDPITGKDKYFFPLTESMVETAVKNIDLDTKDINFRAKNSASIGLTPIVRAMVKNQLDKIQFGEYLDDMERRLAIDGTAVWKTDEDPDKDDEGHARLRITQVDLLNFYIDPTARNIQEAYRVMERSLYTLEEIEKMGQKGWLNTKDVEVAKFLHPTDSRLRQGGGTSEYVDVWEFYGIAAKYFLTGDEDDTKQDSNLHIIVSGLEAGNAHVHLIEEYDGLKPYEEFWYTRVPGRWYGRGIAEKLIVLQVYLNTILNIRVTRDTLAQVGMFKIRRGSGITPQMLSRLPVNGALLLNNMDDLEQLVVQEAGQSSYTDEQNVVSWARQVTSAFEAVTGDNLPASTSATATSIQSQSAQSQFTLIKEGVGMGLTRWLNRHGLKICFKNATRNEIIRIMGDSDEIRALDEKIVNKQLLDKITEIHNAGRFLDPEQVQLEQTKALKTLEMAGSDRYVKLVEDLDIGDYDVEVYITNEEFDKSVMVQNLMQMLQVLPALPNSGIDPAAIVRQALDLMGLDGNTLKAAAPMQQPQQPGQQPGQPAGGQPGQPMPGNNAQMQAAPFTRPGANAPILPPAQTPGQQMAPGRTMEPS